MAKSGKLHAFEIVIDASGAPISTTWRHDGFKGPTPSGLSSADVFTKNVFDGKVIGACMDRHRHQEWIRFLKQIDEETPPDLDLHLIVDNYATHKHPEELAWLAKHPRFHMHFTPTSSSWLNMVERFFRDITDKRIRRGVFKSVPDLKEAIDEYIAAHNAKPKPFIWTAKASDILAKVTRARAVLNKCTSN